MIGDSPVVTIVVSRCFLLNAIIPFRDARTGGPCGSLRVSGGVPNDGNGVLVANGCVDGMLSSSSGSTSLRFPDVSATVNSPGLTFPSRKFQ